MSTEQLQNEAYAATSFVDPYSQARVLLDSEYWITRTMQEHMHKDVLYQEIDTGKPSLAFETSTMWFTLRPTRFWKHAAHEVKPLLEASKFVANEIDNFTPDEQRFFGPFEGNSQVLLNMLTAYKFRIRTNEAVNRKQSQAAHVTLQYKTPLSSKWSIEITSDSDLQKNKIQRHCRNNMFRYKKHKNAIKEQNYCRIYQECMSWFNHTTSHEGDHVHQQVDAC